ncbi:MAG: RagB/SusD family nutrient uptake outer membrane protein, partial [Bacteroidales bacterium]|nr:RagB/SusD family nutrient uptake outer membrane protein [Bacteroidales bacterium]
LEYAQSVIDMNQYNLWVDDDLGSGRLLSAIPSEAKNKEKIKSGYQAAFWCENDGDLANGESLFEIQYVSYWPGRWNAGNLNQEGSNINDFDIPATVNGYGGVVHNGYTSNFPKQGFIDSYEQGDIRKTATLLAPGDTLWLRQWGQDLPNDEGYFVWDGNQGLYGKSMNSAGYMCIKWVWGYTDERESSPVNYKILRYADAFLIKAEALNELGRTNEALEPLNVIRKRAGLESIQSASQDELRLKIYEERKFEFAYEINRYFDAKRSGLLREWIEKDRDIQIQTYQYLLPIPQEAIDLDPLLVQNYGY